MHPGTVLRKASPCVSVCRPRPPGPLVGQAGGRRRCVCVLAFTWVCSPQFPALADIYTEHAHQVVVAKYAPSGFYIASGGTCVHGAGLGRLPGEGSWVWRGPGWLAEPLCLVLFGADKKKYKPPKSSIPEVCSLQRSSQFQPQRSAELPS